MLSNPYQSPETSQCATATRGPVLRWIACGIVCATAVCTGMLAVLLASVGTLRLIVESQQGAGDTNPLFGVEFSLGQALMLGTFVSTLATLVLFSIGYWGLRPRRTTVLEPSSRQPQSVDSAVNFAAQERATEPIDPGSF